MLRTLGSSRVAYIPGDIERTLWVTGHTDLSRLLENTIRWVSGASPSQISVSGHGLVEIFAWQTETGFALHLLNYTNPNASHGWVSEFYSIGPQKVRWALPQSASIKHVELLRRGVAIPFSRNGGSIEFTVPSVEDYEIVALHSR